MASKIEHYARALMKASGPWEITRAFRYLRKVVDAADAEPFVDGLYRRAAKACQRDGELEIDDDAIVSGSDEGDERGAWVAAWLWIGDDDAGFDAGECTALDKRPTLAERG